MIPRWFGSPVSAFVRLTAWSFTAPYLLIALTVPVIGVRSDLVEVDPAARRDELDEPVRAIRDHPRGEPGDARQ